MKIEMYDYQEKAHVDIWKAFLVESRALAVMATGLGKSIVAAFCALTFFNEKSGNIKKPRVLFLCHDKYILEQSLKEFRRVLGERFSLGVFHGDERVYDEVDILFASFWMFSGKGDAEGWKDAHFEDEFDFIIVDESHHSCAKTYRSVLDYFKPRYLLGITATPDRMDRQNIRDIFGAEIVNYPLEMAIARGWLTRVDYRVVSDNLNTPALRKMAKAVLKDGKKISIKQLNETIFVRKRDNYIAAEIMKYDKKTMIFCENKLHADNFQKYIPGSRVCHSGKSFQENQETFQELKDGKVQYFISVNQFNEGKDIPDVELVVFLRCTDSETVFFQQLGRGLRKILGKEKVTVLDFVANCNRVAMVKKLRDGVKSDPVGDFEKDALYFSGDSFDFVFSEEFRVLSDIVAKIRLKKYISDIPELAAEYMPPPKNLLAADEVTAGSRKKVWWKCKWCGYEWEKRGEYRLRVTECPVCAGKVATKNSNLAVTHPDLAKEYMEPPRNELPIEKITAKMYKGFWWKCSNKECGHEWKAFTRSRIGGSGCPGCAGRVATKNNNLTVTHPDLAKEYMPPPKNELPAEKVLVGTSKKLWWKCKECGYEWRAKGGMRKYGRGCPNWRKHKK